MGGRNEGMMEGGGREECGGRVGGGYLYTVRGREGVMMRGRE